VQVPFVLYNIPSLDEATKKWSIPGYLSKAYGDKQQHVEISNTSHFQVSRNSLPDPVFCPPDIKPGLATVCLFMGCLSTIART
jgi:hypothetical protein